MLNKYSFILMIIGLSFAFTDSSESAQRKVVVEDHTGAWCPWCPRGTQTLKDLSEEYGSYFIPVAIHNGNGADMMINADQLTLAQVVGLSGYPGGTVDRAFRGQGTADGTWDPRTRARIGTYSPLEVDVEYSIDGNMLEAVITVTADEDINEQFALNLIVMEDGLTGSGSGWDQRNALSGNASYAGHPYNEKTDPVTNYTHNNVAWKFVEGLWGTTDGVPMMMTAGESFQKTITWDLSEESRIQNTDNVWVVGIAQELNQGEFINADMAGKEDVMETMPLGLNLESTGEQYILNPAGTQATQSFEIRNDNDVEISVNLSTESSILPPNWSAAPSVQSLSVAPGSTEMVTVSLNDNGGQAGYAIVTLELEVTNELQENQFSVQAAESFYVLNDNTKNLFLYGLSADPNAQLTGLSTTAEFMSDIAVMTLSMDVIENFDLSFVETAYFEVNDNNARAFSSVTGDSYRNAIMDMVDSGVDVFLSGGTNLLSTFNDQWGGVSSDNAKSFYTDYLGLSYTSILALVNNNQLVTIPITGQGPLTGLTATVNGSFNAQTQIYDQYLDFASVVEGKDVTILGSVEGLTMSGSPVPTEEAITIAGIQKENAKIAIATFSFETIGTTAQRQLMMDAVYDWLKSDGSAGSAIINVTNNLDFGFVQEATTQDIMVENKGTATLMFSKVQITNDANSQYSFDNSTYPAQGIEPGGSATLKVTYLATEKGTSTADLVITSDDGMNDATIQMSGSAEPTSVSNEIEGVLSLEATPNTFETETNLSVQILGASANVDINLVDVNGNSVQNIFTGNLAGNQTLNINGANLAVGKYFVIANVNGDIARIPVIKK